ncbi:hypothetical protein H6P81_018043 [Aristolochia fimbriata]|uniref:Helitron helicase-like domain-containing protein n=1 Tax=Aristolochia fimbriata TaxID=158543 RepID=A0AAV7E093_ARIFI|nr:hypothetical protein H6P81_018043 [Aristolochia fimbriata]
MDILYHYNAFCPTGIENNEKVFVNFTNTMEELDTNSIEDLYAISSSQCLRCQRKINRYKRGQILRQQKHIDTTTDNLPTFINNTRSNPSVIYAIRTPISTNTFQPPRAIGISHHDSSRPISSQTRQRCKKRTPTISRSTPSRRRRINAQCTSLSQTIDEVFVRVVTQTPNYVTSQGLNVQTSISQTNEINMPLENVGEESDSFIGDSQLSTICLGDATEHAESSTVRASIPRDFKKLWKLEKRMYVCASCNAIMWIEERVRDFTKWSPHYQLCCKKGKVFLPLLSRPPQILQDLYDGKLDRNTYKFKNQVRVYNSMFSFTSIGGKIDNTINDGNGPYTFKISGAYYHRIGSLLPHRGQQPKFVQLYIYDTEHEIQNRMPAFHGEEPNSGVDECLVQIIKDMLDSVNPYVQVFRSARDMINIYQNTELSIRILDSRQTVGRQYNAPTTSEVAAILVGDGSESNNRRDIICCTTQGMLKRINETHPSYKPLQYPLLFPHGEDGWHYPIALRNSATFETDDATNEKTGTVSIREFYAYRL